MANKVEIVNKKAKFEYTILDKYEAGIVLTGTEIKSIRQNKASLSDAYCVLKMVNYGLKIYIFQNMLMALIIIMILNEIENYFYININ